MIILMFMVVSAMTSCRYVNDAADTAFDEFKPSELLKKYEYFKDVSAQLDKKIADIEMFQHKISDLDSSYAGIKRKEWARDDREQMSVWKSELDGIKSSYNALAAEYNSAMSKFNYDFCNAGTLPKGATVPLPREFKPYIYN